MLHVICKAFRSEIPKPRVLAFFLLFFFFKSQGFGIFTQQGSKRNVTVAQALIKQACFMVAFHDDFNSSLWSLALVEECV